MSTQLSHRSCFAACVVAIGIAGCDSEPETGGAPTGAPSQTAQPEQSGHSGKIVGFAFVDAAVTGQGSRATLPPETKIYPPGSRITGTEGCPTTQYRTDGLPVAVLDYSGRPTAGSVTINLVPTPQFGQRPPYYIDLNTGRALQFLGPVFDNGTYEVKFEYFYGQAQTESTAAQFTLDRRCPG
jgi:hypothetical protein